jgi:MlaD protein
MSEKIGFLRLFRERYLSLATGLAFYAFMALIGIYTILVSDIGLVDRGIRIPLRLSSSEGLREAVPVYIKGVEAGVVHSLYYVTLDENDHARPWNASGAPHGQTVIAILHLDEKPELYPNYRIITRYLSILGKKIIEIDPGDARPAVAGGVQNAPLGFQTLTRAETAHFRRTGELPNGRPMLAASNYDDPVYLIATVISENRRDLRRITGNLRDITDKLNAGNRNIALLVNEARLLNGTNAILRDVIILTQEVRDGAEDLRESRAILDFIDVLLAVAGAAL